MVNSMLKVHHNCLSANDAHWQASNQMEIAKLQNRPIHLFAACSGLFSTVILLSAHTGKLVTDDHAQLKNYICAL